MSTTTSVPFPPPPSPPTPPPLPPHLCPTTPPKRSRVSLREIFFDAVDVFVLHNTASGLGFVCTVLLAIVFSTWNSSSTETPLFVPFTETMPARRVQLPDLSCHELENDYVGHDPLTNMYRDKRDNVNLTLVRHRAQRVLDTYDDLPCVCAAMLGFPVPILYVRKHAGILALHNSNVQQMSESLPIVTQERHKFNWPERTDTAKKIRTRQVRVLYHNSECRLLSVILKDQVSVCAQQCYDLQLGKTVYDEDD